MRYAGVRMAMKRFAWILLGASLSTPRVAQSEPVGVGFEVARRPGSEACPDESALLEMIVALFPERQIRRGSDAAHAQARALIVIRPTARGHEATLQLPHVGERRISTQLADCGGLGDALAVALVLMLEAQPDGPTTTKAASPDVSGTRSVAAPPRPKEAVKRLQKEWRTTAAAPLQPARGTVVLRGEPMKLVERGSSERTSWQLHAVASALFGIGVLSQPGGGAQLGGGLFHRSGLGLLATGQRWWSLPAYKATGSVTVDLWSATLAPCLNVLAVETQVWACGSVGFGIQQAVAEGFLQSGEATRPWLVFGPSLRLSQPLSSRVAVMLGVTALAQPWRETFVVDGLGRVAGAHVVGLTIDLGLRFDSKCF